MHPLLKVSIITPSFNQGLYLERNIQSVQRNRNPESPFQIEHIIIDGASSDDTLALLQRHSEILWISEADGGQSDAINKGLRSAKGEIFGWLNSDDTYAGDALSRVIPYFASHPEVDIVFGLCRFVNEHDKLVGLWNPPEFSLANLLYAGISTIPQPAAFFRRRVVTGIGGLDCGLHYAMDYDFWLRAALAGCKFQKLPRVLANFRVHSDSKSVRDKKVHLKESHAVRDRYCKESWAARSFGYFCYKIHRAVDHIGNALRSTALDRESYR